MIQPISYKPSAYYYRLVLRAARTKPDIVKIGMKLATELEKHRSWMRTEGVTPPSTVELETEFEARWILRHSSNRATALAAGLLIVREIERHKESIRAHGLIPPKWYLMPQERRAKRDEKPEEAQPRSASQYGQRVADSGMAE